MFRNILKASRRIAPRMHAYNAFSTKSFGGVMPNNAESIGRTPLVQLNRVIGSDSKAARVVAKIEGRNPAYSVKCRIGYAMVRDAEKSGILKPGVEIVEPTSGNTGIALAFVAAAKGYKLTLTMPDTMSLERRRVMAMLGAELVLTPGAEGIRGCVAKAEEIVASAPGRYWMPQQFKNPSNPNIHYETTGPEIFDDLDGDVDVFVAGVGTGGTITGVSRYLKEKLPHVHSVAVEPEVSALITQQRSGQDLKPSPHKIQGIGANFLPDNLDLSLVDQVETVSNEEAIEMAQRLAREEGILGGISCGAAAAVAVRLAKLPEFEGKTIVTVLPDAGERYLSTALYEGVGE